MKKLLIFTTLIAMCVLPVFAVGLAKMCSKVEGVTSITITKQMMGFLSHVYTQQVDFESLGDKLNQVELINATDESQVKAVKQYVQKYLSDNPGYDEVMAVRDEDQILTLYLKSDSDGLNEYLILIDEISEMTAVLLQGTMTPEDVTECTDIYL